MSIELRNVTFRVGAKWYIYETSLTLEPGDFIFLLGTTLSGKTTLMRLMAGLERPTKGEIWASGKNVTGLAVQQRSVAAMVYQSFINFSSFSIYKILLTIEGGEWGKKEIDEKVHRFADLLQLAPDHSTSSPENSRAASSRERRWRVPWSRERNSSCLMSLLPTLTISFAKSFAMSCRNCLPILEPRWCVPPPSPWRP